MRLGKSQHAIVYRNLPHYPGTAPALSCVGGNRPNMVKNPQNALGTEQWVISLGAIARACDKLGASRSEHAAQVLVYRIRLVWHRLCNRLLVTRDRQDHAASDFEHILTVCHHTLSRFSHERSGFFFNQHATTIETYLALVRRFRREGVPGLVAGLSDARAELKFSLSQVEHRCSLAQT